MVNAWAVSNPRCNTFKRYIYYEYKTMPTKAIIHFICNNVYFLFSLFGAFLLLLILCTLIAVEKFDYVQRAFFLRRKVQRWDEEKLGGIFSINNNNKVSKSL